MKKFAVILAAAAMLAGPAVAQERNTDLVDEGTSVDSLLLRYHFDAMWALDDENLLLRDTYRDHYQVTFDKACTWIDQPRAVVFVPALTSRIRASLPYEARDKNGQICEVAKIAKIPKDEARTKIASVNDRG